MKNWIRNVQANKATVKNETYKWAGEQFIKLALTVGIAWATVTILSGWISPSEYDEMVKTDD